MLIGVLFDVSGSMKTSATIKNRFEEEKEWTGSIFKIINDLVKGNDLSKDHQIFTIAFGGSKPQI